MSNLRKNQIWSWDIDQINVYCRDKWTRDKVIALKNCKQRSVYNYPDGSVAFDVLAPKKLRDKIRGIING